MDAIILAGGKGTRLKKIVSDRPKPLALVSGRPFLEILLNKLEKARIIQRVTLATGYLHGHIDAWSNQQSYSFLLDTSVETKPLGTGGALLQALKKTHSPHIFVLNGDSYLDLDYSRLYQFHLARNADLTICYRAEKQAGRYGTITLNPITSRIQAFKEKEFHASGFINGGVYLFRSSIFQNLSFKEHFSLEMDAFPLLTKKRCFGYYCSGKFIDIGTEHSYINAQELLKNEES